MKSRFLEQHGIKGVGDMVAAGAQPIARVIDKVAAKIGRKTNVAGCGRCKKTQKDLNDWWTF